MKPDTARTAAVLALFVASAYLLRGVLGALCWACLIAVSTWPLHDRIQRALPDRGRSLGAALFTAVAVLILLLPIVYVALRAALEMPVLMHLWANSQEAGLPAPDWLGHVPGVGPWALLQWNAHLAEPGALNEVVHGLAHRLTFQSGRGWVAALGHRAMSVFFCILVLFFLYLRGDALAAQFQAIVVHYLQAPGLRATRLAVAAVRGIVNGLLLVGLAMALVMSVAYALAGVTHAALWGLLTGLLGMVPFGAALVLAGVVLYLLALNATTAALSMAVFGGVLIFVVDHFVRPAFISGPSRVPVVIALLGIVGGLETMGLLGLFVGPTLLAITVAVWRELAGPAALRPDGGAL